MTWNWQQIKWPHFQYKADVLRDLEEQFLMKSGIFLGAYEHINDEDRHSLIVDLITDEAIKTSEIEGEYLIRESVQSSLRQNFGFTTDGEKIPKAEQGISEMMVALYRSYSEPLSHETLFKWHAMLLKGRGDLKDIGCYRTHPEPMQVVSGSFHAPKIHFEAPPSKNVLKEMDRFIEWFNNSAPQGSEPIPTLTRVGIAHLYFVCIHPFEDGNGRIGRAIAAKVLSQSLGQPTLIALSQIIHKHRKAYYDFLEKNNKELEITSWLLYFAQTVLEAQEYTRTFVKFMIEKTKLYDKVRGKLNKRQEKALTRLFREGMSGFKGGLSAENYISITKASRATATRDLTKLVKLEVLRSTGELKGTRYYLNIDL